MGLCKVEFGEEESQAEKKERKKIQGLTSPSLAASKMTAQLPTLSSPLTPHKAN